VSTQRHVGRGPGPSVLVEEGEPEKRRAILHAAVRVFAEKGYHGCRIADVARQAGVAYGLVYHYFQNKEALLESVFAEQWTIFMNALRAMSEGPGGAAEQLAGVCRFAIDVYRTAPAAVRVLLLEVSRAPDAFRAGSTRQAFQDAIGIVAGIVRRGQERGEVRSDVDPVVAAAGLLGALELTLTAMVTGILRDSSDDGIERVKGSVVGLVLSGLVLRER
jgi:TetR/AcrR family transcriptional regulator, fatty acid metabolism regulator protein